MNDLYVTMRWKDKHWEPLCGPVDLEAAEELLDEDHISRIFPASQDAIHLAQQGGSENEDG